MDCRMPKRSLLAHSGGQESLNHQGNQKDRAAKKRNEHGAVHRPAVQGQVGAAIVLQIQRMIPGEVQHRHIPALPVCLGAGAEP